MSEASRKKAEEIAEGDDALLRVVTAALDEAREEGAQRERWECHRIAAETPDECGEYWRSCERCGAHIADAISARGPMRGPEEE